MKTDIIVLVVIILAAIYFGVMITISAAPLWLKVPVDLGLLFVIMGAGDALIAIISGNAGEGRV